MTQTFDKRPIAKCGNVRNSRFYGFDLVILVCGTIHFAALPSFTILAPDASHKSEQICIYYASSYMYMYMSSNK